MIFMPGMKAQGSKNIFVFLRILVVAVGIIWAIAWLSRENRWSRLVDIFHRMNIGLFVCTLCVFIIGQVIISLRWWLLVRAQSIFIGFWAAVRLNFLGWFYNNFMPGSVGGDLIRAWYVTKYTDKKLEAVLSVFVDRVVIGLLGTLSIAVFFYLFFLRGELESLTLTSHVGFFETVARYKWLLCGIIIVIAVVFCGFLLFGQGRLILERTWLYIYKQGLKTFKKLKQTILIYFSSPLTILAAFGLTVFLQLLTITAFWFLGRNLGIDVGVKYYYLIFTLAWVLGALPVSIGGAVVVEGFLAFLFVRFTGIEAESALAIALCQRVVWMIASLPGAVIHLAGAHLPKDFSLDYDRLVD
jgi:uncharacterized protein (TIRG00374 family)